MKPQLTPQDQQNLSAYLDGQLSERERVQMETRLASQPALQEELESLRRARALLRLTPQRRAPRNYTIKPEMAAAWRGFQWIPTLRFSSALASILAVVAVAINLLPLGAGAITPMAAQDMSDAQAPAMVAESYAAEVPTPMIVIWGNAAPAGMGGYGGGPTNDREGIAPEATLAAEVEKASTSGTPTEEPTPQALAAMPPVEGNGPILGVRPTEEAGKIQSQPGVAPQGLTATNAADEAASASSERSAYQSPVSNRWLLPAALLVVAIFTGGMAIFLQRRKV